MDFLSALDGWKTKIAALGMFSLGVYQLTQGQYDLGLQSIIAALGLFGIKSALVKDSTTIKAELAEVKAKLSRKE